MKDETLREAYDVLMVRRANERHGADCPPPDALIALVERRGAEADRLATLDRVMACAACQADLELVRSVHAAAKVEGAAPVTPRPRRALPVPPLAAAAALAVVAAGVVLWFSGRASEDVLRGNDVAVILVSPAPSAPVDPPAVLVWRSVANATAYDVEVLDAAGASAFRTQTGDTLVSAPLADGSYQWWVRARMPDGGVTRSELAELIIDGR